MTPTLNPKFTDNIQDCLVLYKNIIGNHINTIFISLSDYFGHIAKIRFNVENNFCLFSILQIDDQTKTSDIEKYVMRNSINNHNECMNNILKYYTEQKIYPITMNIDMKNLKSSFEIHKKILKLMDISLKYINIFNNPRTSLTHLFFELSNNKEFSEIIIQDKFINIMQFLHNMLINQYTEELLDKTPIYFQIDSNGDRIAHSLDNNSWTEISRAYLLTLED